MLFAEIAKEANRALEIAKSEKYSEARVAPDAPGSPRATTTSAPFLPPSSPEIGRS